jgi:ADP-ribosylglycohydrolase
MMTRHLCHDEPDPVPLNTPRSRPLNDRVLGALLGLATGDAVGTTLEFRPPGTFEPIDDMVGGGPFQLRAGEWTDDTAMALCLAESLVSTGGFDAADQMRRYVRWYREGHLSCTGTCFDIGRTTRAALERFEVSGEPFAGATDPRSAGNGSIMRLAPVAIFFAAHPAEAIERCADSSRTTHGATEAVDACRYLAALLVGALNGTSRDELLSERYTPIPGYWQDHPLCPRIDDVACGSFRRREPPRIRGSGYVVESLEAALWAFHRSSNFREGCLLAVNLGDDADTTGAVYGQIAGAFYGSNGIPAAWLDRLAMRSTIEGLGRKLAEASRDDAGHTQRFTSRSRP